VTAVVTPLGWSVFAAGAVTGVAGRLLGWTELVVIAVACWLLLALAALLMIGRARLAVSLVADPQRVTVGDPAAGAVAVRNTARRPMLPLGLELPIATGVARFMLPTLPAKGEHEELFVVPTGRRGVVVVGPASTVRGDPLGLLRRSAAWTNSLDIFVHPVTVHLDSLGAGFLRDLEGQTTNDLSNSDLAFHALREYEPGDDLRFIHWRSSAKLGKFMVRQFQDTRRSHLAVVVDSDAASYPDPEDYELAISAGASLTIRVVQDDQEVTVLAGAHVQPAATYGNRVLDLFSRAELGDHRLADLARRANRIAPDLSTAILVTGTTLPYVEILRAANEFPPEVRVIALVVDPTRPSAVKESAVPRILTLGRLADLPLMFQAVSA
jgi:uncharacterized protein (DUF58 family)